jgi:pimeloyl-ACP methyl ester carboxylesterase
MIYIAFLVFTFLILFIAFYQWQYFMIFSPVYYRDEKLCDACGVLSVRSEDGVELEGAVYEPSNANATLLVFVGRSHDAVGLINKLAQNYAQTRVIAFNYRSYGKSQGKINEQNLMNDALHIAKLVQKNYGSFSILGYSLGSSVAAYVASKQKVEKLFLVGAFDSIANLAKTKFVDRSFMPYINLTNIFRYKFRTIEYVQSVDAPSYLFVSKDDEVTYIDNARVLKNKIKNLAIYKELDMLDHKELLWDDEVIKTINKALAL